MFVETQPRPNRSPRGKALFDIGRARARNGTRQQRNDLRALPQVGETEGSGAVSEPPASDKRKGRAAGGARLKP